jgi:hypothetical protein
MVLEAVIVCKGRAKVLMNGLLRAKRVLIEAVRVSTETTRVSIGP